MLSIALELSFFILISLEPAFLVVEQVSTVSGMWIFGDAGRRRREYAAVDVGREPPAKLPVQAFWNQSPRRVKIARWAFRVLSLD